MAQKFRASKATRFVHPNGAIAYGPGGSFDCLGRYALVQNCPVIVDGATVARLTCYATGYADTAFSVPACTRYRQKHIGGYFSHSDDGVVFNPYDRFKSALEGAALKSLYWLRMGSDYLEDAVAYTSKRAAVEAYLATARDLARYEQRIEATIHLAPDRETLAEYPDYVLSLGKGGGVKIERA